MPPDNPRPPHDDYVQAAAFLEGQLDAAAATQPNAGDVPLFRRLTRTEYKNAIRDLAGARPSAERARLRAAAARRQREQRLRQHRGPAVRLTGRHGTLHRHRAEARAARGRRPAHAGHGEHPEALGAAAPGRAPRRAVLRHARRARGRQLLSARRRVHVRDRNGAAVRASNTRSRSASTAYAPTCKAIGAPSPVPRSFRDAGSRAVPRARHGRAAPRRHHVRRALGGARRGPRARSRSAAAARCLPSRSRRFAARTHRPGAGDTPSRRRIFVCRPSAAEDRDAVRARNPDDARAARVSAPGHGRRPRSAHAVLRARPRRRRLRRRHPARARAPAREPAVPVSRRTRAEWRRSGARDRRA